MNTDPFESQKAVQAAVDALRRGDKVKAQELAHIATMVAPDSETPWLILAALTSPAESLGYIQQALQINPNSKAALQAKRWALQKLHAQAPIPPEYQPPVPPAFQPYEESTSQEIEPSPEQPHSERDAFLDRLEKQQEEPEGVSELQGQTGAQAEPVFESAPPTFNEFRPAAPEIEEPQTEEETKQGKIPSFAQARTFWMVLIGLLVVSLVAGIIILRPFFSGQFAGSLAGNKCIASLMIGSKSYEVRTVVPKSDGSFLPPANRTGVIYWVEGTDTNLVFALGTTADNLVLAPAVTPGNVITLVWPNCNTARFTIIELKPDQPFKLSMVDLTMARISIFIPSVRENKGYLVNGELMDQSVSALASPSPAAP